MSIFGLFISVSAYAIGIRLEATSGGILEDAILIASENGEPVRDVIALGDFDLSLTEHTFDVPVDPATTHWWLIGHEGGNVVYSSTLDLNGIDMYSVEPYDGSGLAWNIPSNLDGYVNGGVAGVDYSWDWWSQTTNNHHSHVAADGGTSNLWLFSSPGSGFGSIAVNLHSNDIPAPVPEPTIMFLVCSGLFGLAIFKKKFKKS